MTIQWVQVWYENYVYNENLKTILNILNQLYVFTMYVNDI